VLAAGLVLVMAAGCGSTTAARRSARGVAARGSAVTSSTAAAPAGATGIITGSGTAGVRPNARAMRGHGELAFVTGGRLFLLGGKAHRLRRVRLPGIADAPAWSPDHRWLAVAVTKPWPAAKPWLQGRARLWLVSATGTRIRRLTPRSWNVASFAWSPRADQLVAVAYRSRAPYGSSYVAATITRSGAGRILAAGSYVSGAAWSPDGRQVAAGVAAFRRQRWLGRLDLLSPAGGRPEVVAASTGNVIELAGWWPGGSGLLYWLEIQGSPSLAADGLALDTVAPGAMRPRQVAFMLGHGSWLAFPRHGHVVAAVSGGSREIWFGHKHITICRPAGGCEPVAQPGGVVSLDPSWSPGGRRLAFARLSASGPFGPHGHAFFSPSWIRRWEATSQLWLAGANGSGARPLAAAGRGAVDPVFGRDGSLLFVRDDSVWLLPRGAARPARMTGPLGAFSGRVYGQTYYGYVPYPQLIAWTLAPPTATTSNS
jgi:hypothetical protein